ncbi:hypothetical protein CVT25_007357 [Psilocybe cyanescens]|uniref:Uncharacterized protein n=1 Tax=Psilocybe cyanescens TaxID=93625 RepID=A0A409XJE5_PSICY|nr:hypothetical protein CVT25_007357 [Psilocybe cyanescens]
MVLKFDFGLKCSPLILFSPSAGLRQLQFLSTRALHETSDIRREDGYDATPVKTNTAVSNRRCSEGISGAAREWAGGYCLNPYSALRPTTPRHCQRSGKDAVFAQLPEAHLDSGCPLLVAASISHSRWGRVYHHSGYGSLHRRQDIPNRLARDVFVDARKDDEQALGRGKAGSPIDFVDHIPQDPTHPLGIALERRGTVEIYTITDWQHTAVLLLYLIPHFIEDAEPALGQEDDAFFKEQAYMLKAYHALYQETAIDVVWASGLSFGDRFTMA